MEVSIIQKLIDQKIRLSQFYTKSGNHALYFSRKVGYFLQVLNFEPQVLDGRGKKRPPSEFKTVYFRDAASANAALCCLNSNLFYWFITVFSDCRHVNKREVDGFLINLSSLIVHPASGELSTLGILLMKNLKQTSEVRKMKFKHNSLTVQCIIPKHSKSIIDKIDSTLAKYYHFTPEELDFLINYDIKYRMGRDAEIDADAA